VVRKRKQTDSASGNTLQSRLGLLVQEHSLSGLARRTSTPVSSIHRYVNGGRTPSEFCAALARELQVNPGWLLLGEGARYSTDVGGDAAAMASGMREIVDAMNAASRLRLGTLARRRDLSLLRELADASAKQEELRGRLTRQVEPVIRDWLAALNDALTKFEHVRAADLEEALARLLRFTDDTALMREFDRLRAHSAYIRGRRVEAVALQRRNLMLLLAEGSELGEAELRECFRLCVALAGLGRCEEGKAVAEATLTLRRGGPLTASAQLVRSMLAAFELNLGNAARAVALVDEVWPRRTPESAPNIELLRAMIMLRVHALSVASVLREVPPGLPLVLDLLRNALWREDPAEIRLVLDYARRNDERWLDTAGLHAAQADWMSRIRGKRCPVLPANIAELDARLEGGEILERLDLAVLQAQRARLLGAPNAGGLTLRAHEALRAAPPDVQPDAVIYGIHARNVLALHNPALAGEVRARIADLLARGFGMFREFAAEHGIAK
jgi:hypothetical protein